MQLFIYDYITYMYNVVEPVGLATTAIVEPLRIHIEKRKGTEDSLAYIAY